MYRFQNGKHSDLNKIASNISFSSRVGVVYYKLFRMLLENLMHTKAYSKSFLKKVSRVFD